MAAGYPRAIAADWAGLPDSIDAAFTWPGSGATYIFKGHPVRSLHIFSLHIFDIDPLLIKVKHAFIRTAYLYYSLLSNAYVASDANLCITYKSKHTKLVYPTVLLSATYGWSHTHIT